MLDVFAEQIWRRAARQQPQNAKAYLRLGDALIQQKSKSKEAIAAEFDEAQGNLKRVEQQLKTQK